MGEVNIEELKKKVDEGDMNAMFELACCYTEGVGVDVDYKMAFKYWKQVAHLGDPEAMANLAIFYAQGVCGGKDVIKALDLFHGAVCQGVDVSEYVFRNIKMEDLRDLALKGHPSAEYYYALSLGDDKEREWFLSSASKKKLAMAASGLALRCYLANPTPSNLKAKKLFQQAVDYGCDYSQMLNSIATVEQQMGMVNKINVCDAIRYFMREKYERPYILVRITEKKWAEKLVKEGSIRFATIGGYRKNDKSGVGDFFEGTANTGNALPFWQEIDDGTISETQSLAMLDEYMAHEKICSLYALEYSEDKEFVKPDIRMRQFGDSVVVIWDGPEFCRRIENELRKKYGDSIWFGHKRVDYNVIFSKSQTYTEFSKTEPYAWQNEYRLVLDLANGKVERTEWDREPSKDPQNLFDHLGGMSDYAKLMYSFPDGKQEFFEDPGDIVISIGNIEDIGDMYSIEEFINLSNKITEKARPYRIDDSSDNLNYLRASASRPFCNAENLLKDFTMSNFEEFKHVLIEKGVSLDGQTLKALELYHEWFIDRCSTELYESAMKAGKEKFNRTGNEPFLM